MGRVHYTPERYVDEISPAGRLTPSSWLTLHQGEICLTPAFEGEGVPQIVKPGEVVVFNVWEEFEAVPAVITDTDCVLQGDIDPRANWFWDEAAWEGFASIDEVVNDIRALPGDLGEGQLFQIKSHFTGDDFRQKFRLVTSPTGALFHKVTEH